MPSIKLAGLRISRAVPDVSRHSAGGTARRLALGAVAISTTALVLALSACGGGGSGGYDYPAATVDSTFGDGGKVFVANVRPRGVATTSFSATSIAVDGSDRILVAGHRWQVEREAWFMRLQADGRPDSSCGAGGWVRWSTGGPATVRSVLALSDGRIAVAGLLPATAIRIFKADCSPDASVGVDGVVTFDEAISLAAMPEVWAVAQDPASQRIAVAVRGHVMLLEPDGSRVQTFGTNGVASTTLPDGSALEPASVAFLSGGKLLLGGAVDYGLADGTFAGFLRLQADGQIDSTFGTGGESLQKIGGNFATGATGMAVFGDGFAVMTGLSQRSVRLEDGLPDAFWAMVDPSGTPVGFGGAGQALWNPRTGNGINYSAGRPIVTDRSEVVACGYWLNNSGIAGSATAVERGLLQFRDSTGATVTRVGEDGTLTTPTACSGVAETSTGNLAVLGAVVTDRPLSDTGFYVTLVSRP